MCRGVAPGHGSCRSHSNICQLRPRPAVCHARESASSASSSLSTVAGDGAYRHADGVGTHASFCVTQGIAATTMSGQTVLYVSTLRPNGGSIRKITIGSDSNAAVSTLAGGTAADCGDVAGKGHTDGMGTAARFFEPRSVAVFEWCW